MLSDFAHGPMSDRTEPIDPRNDVDTDAVRSAKFWEKTRMLFHGRLYYRASGECHGGYNATLALAIFLAIIC